ncbi:MAG: hypothetical protein E2590_12760 [Chryseobacterium sp.]|nr:hypothetical protein [Chryseobacterium sp.]
MNPNDFIRNIVTDTKIKLSDEFDRNFERKAFFDKKWPATKLRNTKGSLMVRSGNLRRSIQSPKTSNTGIIWTSSLPYSNIHNKGGEIVVTEKMKRFFWAMYYKTSGALTRIKSGELSSNQRNMRIKSEAEQWKALALQKVGAKMKIEKRQYLGHHPQIDKFLKEIVDKNIKDLNDDWKHNYLINR